jgi:hypothetical protein
VIPSASRIVHYVGHPDVACRAAIITAVDQPTGPEEHITLTVFAPLALMFDTTVARHDGHETHLDAQPPGMCGGRIYPPGTWHWPARTPEGPP